MKDVTVLREALPYIQKHRDTLFVVKMGGELAENPEVLHLLAQDITLLHLVGIQIVVVHGGGPQLSALSQQMGHEPQQIGGRRITDEATLDLAKMVFAGKINVEILSALRKCATRAVGLSGVDGDIIHAKRREITKMKDDVTGKMRRIDFGFVGDIVEVDVKLLNDLIERKYVPVISSLGADKEGVIYNINADTVASEIARTMKAAKYITLTNVPGVLRNPEDPDSLISVLTLKEAKELIKKDGVKKGMVPKLQACIHAIEGGVPRAHVLNGFDPHMLLLEVFTEKGAGTMIVQEKDGDASLREPSPVPPPAKA